MANGYRVYLDSIASDGTNLFLEVRIQSNLGTTFPTIRPVFPVGTTVAQINTYLQAIADAGPTLAAGLPELVGSSVKGA